MAALNKLPDMAAEREQVMRNAARLRQGLIRLGFQVAAADGPIIACPLPDRDYAARFWRSLIEDGIYVNVMMPPATPGGLALLRCSVNAHHTADMIDRAVRGFGTALASLRHAIPA